MTGASGMRWRPWLGIGIVGLGVAGGWAWYQMGAPMYRPGSLRESGIVLEPPAQSGSGGPWRVEPGIELRHFASGSGRNVVAIHGGPGYPFPGPLAALGPLESRYRFHYYDQRGCGRSTRPFRPDSDEGFYANLLRLESSLGIGAQIADLERIRRILGDEQVVLLGHSYGALLAVLYASEFPDRVAGMILVAPAQLLVMPDPEGDLFTQVAEHLPPEKREEFDAFLREYLDLGSVFERTEEESADLHRRFVPFYAAAADARGFSVEPGSAEDAGGFMVQAQFFSMGRRHDYRPALARATAPALVVHGSVDLQPEAASRRYVSSLPAARMQVIEGAGHAPFADRPEAFREAVEAFLDGLP